MVNAGLGVVYKLLAEQIRYWFDSLALITSGFMIFLLVFLTGRLAGPSFLGADLSATVVSFFAWSLVITQWQGVGWALSEEAEMGTLENLSLCRYGFVPVVAGQIGATVVSSFLPNLVTLLLVLLVTGERLHVDLVPVGLVLLVLSLQGCGVGLIVAGLALRFKRVGSALSFMNMVVALLVATPLERAPLLAVAPLTLAADLLRRLVAGGTELKLLLGDLGLSALLGTMYLAIGWRLFVMADRHARMRGTLAQY